MWITYDSKTMELSQWLKTYKPSKVTQREANWIYVKNENAMDIFEYNEQLAIEEWRKIIAERQPTEEDIDNLARKYKVLSGKWLVFGNTDEIDKIWDTIASATFDSSLGFGSKVSPKSDTDPSHVICVYTQNYLDEAETKRVRETLAKLGFKTTLNYKPDIYTYFGIYSKNPWNLSASKYCI